MLTGILITVFTYIGIFDLGNSFIVAYGPAFGGLGMAITGKLKMNN